MNKKEILDKIRHIAANDGGRVPGSQRLESLTGLRKVDWYPKYWLRWSDAVREAGLEPNKLSRRFEPALLIAKYIELARDLGRFPIEGDLMNKRRCDKSFPSRSAFKPMGGKRVRVAAVMEYCQIHEGFDDVAALCAEVLTQSSISEEVVVDNPSVGYVYLFRHGSRHESPGCPISSVIWWWCIWIAMIEYESLARDWPRRLKGANMNQELDNQRDADMLDEYDFSGGVRGKYAGRFAKGSNVVVLDPDVAQVFPDSESVNQALRALAEIIQHQSEKTHPSRLTSHAYRKRHRLPFFYLFSALYVVFLRH